MISMDYMYLGIDLGQEESQEEVHGVRTHSGHEGRQHRNCVRRSGAQERKGGLRHQEGRERHQEPGM